MTEMQKKLLEMFSWFTKFLDANNITYYAVGGTLLGAVRHKGFIPWDDDIDIAIPRPEYNRLIELFKEKRDHYVLETPYEKNKDFLYSFSKLYDVDTTLIERQRHNIKRGLYIDVFPLDGAGNNYKEASKIYRKCSRKSILYKASMFAVRKQRKWYKNALIIASRMIPFYNIKKSSLKIDRLFSKYSYENSEYVCNFNGSYGSKEITEKRLFGTPKEYDFEHLKIKGPEFFDEYLTRIYHNWKELPPVEKRGIQHDFILLDLNKSYFDE